jgi:hypothetical protein
MAATIPAEVKKVAAIIFPADARGNLVRDPRTNNAISCGTGFFVAIKNDIGQGIKNDIGQGMYGYLVTAKHVLKDAQGNDLVRIYFSLNKLKGDAEFVALDLTHDGHVDVYSHPDPSVDIAVIPAWPSEDVFDFKVIPQYMLTTREMFKDLNIVEGSAVFFLEAVATSHEEKSDSYLFRFGHVAMVPEEHIRWVDDEAQSEKYAKLYLIETQSRGCNSGSPVFVSVGMDRLPKGGFMFGSPVVKLAGIMRGKVVNEADPSLGSSKGTRAPAPVMSTSVGIAAVTPPYFLDEILFSDQLRTLRDEHPIVTSPKKWGKLVGG